MRRTLIAIGLLTVAGCGFPGEGESPISGGSPSSQATVVVSAVHGVVRDRAGTLVADVMVAATSLDVPARPVPEVAVMTGRDGRFEWPLPAGRYRLDAGVEGLGAGSVEVTVAADQPGPVVQIQFR